MSAWSENSVPVIHMVISTKMILILLQPSENLLLQHDGKCNDGQFKLMIDLEMNARYILLVTTHRPKTVGNFSIFISGPNNVSLQSFQ